MIKQDAATGGLCFDHNLCCFAMANFVLDYFKHYYDRLCYKLRIIRIRHLPNPMYPMYPI
jgi:hypothetical protein